MILGTIPVLLLYVLYPFVRDHSCNALTTKKPGSGPIPSYRSLAGTWDCCKRYSKASKRRLSHGGIGTYLFWPSRQIVAYPLPNNHDLKVLCLNLRVFFYCFYFRFDSLRFDRLPMPRSGNSPMSKGFPKPK